MMRRSAVLVANLLLAFALVAIGLGPAAFQPSVSAARQATPPRPPRSGQPLSPSRVTRRP